MNQILLVGCLDRGSWSIKIRTQGKGTGGGGGPGGGKGKIDKFTKFTCEVYPKSTHLSLPTFEFGFVWIR